MNLEELTYHGAHLTGGAMGLYRGFSQGELGAALGGLVLGVLVGWTLCFVPFFAARAFEEREREGAAKGFWGLGLLAPILAPSVMFFLG
ncbi:hypothetical protein [Roseibacillus persicicus]|uniref:Uncharacterized protein n=1 Tax=Roseibacillus persicicus TaxID=454148 RepID=A0A918TV95_9BACT|nr:hypothetical protein [Roseibacillus persicicus]GHC61651.1 hypothetical protein GCM10007100_31300 [Roseibacillus persicicus]